MPSSNTSVALAELRKALKTLKSIQQLHRAWQTPRDAGRVRSVCKICSLDPWDGPVPFPCYTHRRLSQAITRLETAMLALADAPAGKPAKRQRIQMAIIDVGRYTVARNKKR